MLSQIGQNSSQFPLINGNDHKSPYLMQYKTFQDRLKKQQRKNKVTSFVPKNKKVKSCFNEDYIELAKNIISKKQNFNLLDDLPLETEPSVNLSYNQQLTAKTRLLFQRNNNKKKTYATSQKDQVLSQMKQNSVYVKSRVASQSITNLLRQNKNKSQCITFLGYKKNKRPVIQRGFKKILGQT